MKRIASVFLALATLAFSVLNLSARDLSSKALQQRTLERRPVDASDELLRAHSRCPAKAELTAKDEQKNLYASTNL